MNYFQFIEGLQEIFSYIELLSLKVVIFIITMRWLWKKLQEEISRH